MFKNYTIARLVASKPKRCKCCGLREEKIQGYCSECLKIEAPEIKEILENHSNESQANSNLGKVFMLVTIGIIVAMVWF